MIKNRLLEIRLSKGFKTQKEFSKFLNIARNQYNRYELNLIQPNLETTYFILSTLNISFFDLFFLEN